MPELPEVETVARGLRTLLVGRTIIDAIVSWPRTVAFPDVDEFERRIAGRQVLSVGRRGKYLIVELDQGYLLIHLKMSGRLRLMPAQAPQDKHTHLRFTLDGGQELHFHDTRKFGRVYLVEDVSQVTGGLGPEPLQEDLTLDRFHQMLGRRSGRLKSVLLDQTFLAGVGNIYADEALFAARIHPLRKADSLTPEEQASLLTAIRAVLDRAIAGRGTTLDDRGYVDANGRAGTYQEQISVYSRTGEPCPVCSTPIERIVVGSRSTHFCPHCQQ